MISVGTASRIVRFALVGGTASVIYAMVTWLLVNSFSMTPTSASIISYMFAIPVSFLGQKYFTFRADGNVKIEFGLFTIGHVVGLVLSTVIMAVTQLYAVDIKLGILCVMIAVPIASYLFVNFLVFPMRTRAG